MQERNFTKTGELLDSLAAQAGEEYQLNGLRIQGNSPEGVGIQCQTAAGQNTVSIQLSNLRVFGPLRSGIETAGTLWKFSITDSVCAECAAGIRFQNATLIEVSLINNTIAQNERGIVFAQAADSASNNLRIWHTLFSGNTQADAVLESGDPTALAEKLFVPVEGRHHNRTDRKDPDTNGMDLFTGDGQRGAATSFVSLDLTNLGYLKPSTTDVNVAAPASGAKGYVGAIAP